MRKPGRRSLPSWPRSPSPTRKTDERRSQRHFLKCKTDFLKRQTKSERAFGTDTQNHAKTGKTKPSLLSPKPLPHPENGRTPNGPARPVIPEDRNEDTRSGACQRATRPGASQGSARPARATIVPWCIPRASGCPCRPRALRNAARRRAPGQVPHRHASEEQDDPWTGGNRPSHGRERP